MKVLLLAFLSTQGLINQYPLVPLFQVSSHGHNKQSRPTRPPHLPKKFKMPKHHYQDGPLFIPALKEQV